MRGHEPFERRESLQANNEHQLNDGSAVLAGGACVARAVFPAGTPRKVKPIAAGRRCCSRTAHRQS